MVKKFGKRLITLLLAVLLVASMLPLNAFASTVNVLEGKISITDTQNTVSVSGGTVTATAKGNFLGKKTNTLTITNETDSSATLSFDYIVSNSSSFKINGATAATSGTYNILLAAGGSVTVAATSNSGISNLTVTVTLSNFSLTAAAASSNVTVEYDSSLGSVTAGGDAIASGDVKEGVTLTEGVALVATVNSGATFHGWVGENGSVLSTALSYTLKPSADMTIKAVFTGANSKPHFLVGVATQKTQSAGLLGLGKLYYHTVSGSYIFDDLNEAASFAAASPSSKAIVLMNDGTLSAGTYTIPSGVTLLIPFDSQNSLYTNDVLSLYDKDSTTSVYSTPTAYRTLTMADGANLVINGSVSLSAKQRAAQGSKRNGGSPTGPVSFIEMQGNSNITVNNGGNLYAYGFITGSGTVIANSGSSIHENFQFMDFRGGTQSTDMQNGVFPLSQYYVQNIEVPLTLYSGAKEYAYTTIYMSSADFGSAVAFIGSSGCMFNLTSGYVVKKYDGAKDRLLVEINGDVSIASIEMSVGTSTINSKKYELPINSNLTVDVKVGNINVAQDLAFLPGSEMIIRNGTKCTINSGYNVYIYDLDEWGNYAFDSDKKYTSFGNGVNGPFVPLTYAPGRTYNRTLNDLKDAMVQIDGTIDASAGYVYTTAGGANVFSTGTGVVNVTAGTQTISHQLVQNTGYSEIPLTTAKLKNSDGSYLQSSTKSYTYTEGFWRCTNAEHVYTDVVTPPTCTDKGYTTHTCSVCGKVAVDTYVDALGHNYLDEIVAPTCEDGGYTKHTCSNCGDSYIDSETAALGHSYEEKIITEPTCTETGLKEYTCTACSDSYTEPIASNDHDLEETIYAPTCTEAGKTVYSCKNCDYVLEEPGEPANGHSWSGWEVVANAGCEAAGEEKRTCSSCNAVETRVVEATGHSYSSVVTAPTCTEQGYTTYTCSTCSHSYVDNYVGALGHSYNSVVTAPTCLEQGYTTHTCSVCDNVVVDTYVDALGHDYDAVVTAPTCTEQGYTTYTCHCGETYVNDYVAATGHSMGDWIIDTPADCVNKGIKHAECADCDYTEKEEIPAIGHSYEAEVTAPTCTAEGYTTYTCHCGDSYVDNYVSALGHSHEAEVTAPTCTAEGYTTYTCHCGDSYVDNYVAALGHSYGEWEVEKDATHTEEGIKSHSCENCGDVESEAILVIICDIDNDGIVNSTELAKMRQYLIGKTTITETETLLMDMDDNGTVNIVDLIKLKKYIAANVTVTE